jgi:hypothetical protein
MASTYRVLAQANSAAGRSANTVTNKALTSNVATLTTGTAHGYVANDHIVVSGVDTTFNTKGDLLVATANDVYTNLAAGSNGLVLTTNSATATGLQWSQGLPTQTSNATKFLQTDGTTASWQAVVTDPTPTVFLMMGA